jgi:hypothetical protein
MIDGTQKLPDYSSNSRRATCNFQSGGAIYAYRADVKIYTSTFDTNTAEKVSG